MVNNKKVVFYNVSTYSLCQYKYYALNKMRIFFENSTKEQYLIWWRPHPKQEDELKFYDINLYDAYMDLREDFVKCKYGVLDLNTSFEEAFSISDIYYGDMGSVKDKFYDTGKPVIRINYDGLFFPIGICKYENFIYGTDHDTASIVRFDIERNQWEYVASIPGYENFTRAFHKSISQKHFIYFIPYMASDLAVYDVEKDEVSIIELGIDEKKQGKYKTNFFGFSNWQNKMYLYPASYSDILTVDLDCGDVGKYLDVRNYVYDDKIITWISWVKYQPGKIALCSMQNNQVVVINLDTAELEAYRVGDEHYLYNAIRYHNDLFYLAVKNCPKIIVWDMENDSSEEIDLSNEDTVVYGPTILDDHANCVYNGQLFCIPAKSNVACTVNLSNREIRRIEAFDEMLNMNTLNSQFDTVVVDENIIYLQKDGLEFLLFDMNSKTIIQKAVCELSIYDTTKQEIDLIIGELNRRV